MYKKFNIFLLIIFSHLCGCFNPDTVVSLKFPKSSLKNTGSDSGTISGSIYQPFFTALPSGHCLSDDTQKVFCWGKEYSSTASELTNIQSALSFGDNKTIKSIKNMHGQTHCVVANDDLAYCWGLGTSGQLGIGNPYNSRVPIPVDTSGALNGKTIQQIITQVGKTCALASDNLVYCWGGFTPALNYPTSIHTTGPLSGLTVKSLVMSNQEVICLIASDDLPYCMGSNVTGQLGNGSNTNVTSAEPVAVDTSGVLSGKTVKKIFVSNFTVCVIASDDLPYCWGQGGSGQLGNGVNSNSNVPVAVVTAGVLSGKTIKNLAVTDSHVCAIANDDLAYCWGNTANVGTTTIPSNVPVAVDTSGVLNGKTILSMSARWNTTCALASDNLVYCWGDNNFGNLGNGTGTNSTPPVAVDMSGILAGKTVKELEVGGYTNCVIADDDLPYCWGNNFSGNLGDGTTTNSNAPVAVTMSGSMNGKTVKKISVSTHSVCHVTNDDKLYCAGRGNEGNLGDGNLSDSNVPVSLYTNTSSSENLSDHELLIPSSHHGLCLLRANNDLFCGRMKNGLSFLLNFSTLQIAKIFPNPTGTHECALTTSNIAYCWGNNSSGQLGNGTNSTSSVAVAVDLSGVLNGKAIKELYPVGDTTCALTTENKLYCWGAGTSGQLGNGVSSNSNIPIEVSTAGVLSGKTIKNFQMNTQGRTACAVADDDKVYCWGVGTSGELGNGSSLTSNIPVAVNFTGVLSGKTTKKLNLTNSTYHVCIIASDDLGYCWGYNNAGQLGNNSTVLSNVPVSINTSGVLNGKTLKQLALGNRRTCALADDNLPYCWGLGTQGGNGDGANSNSSVPVAVDVTGVLSGKSFTTISSDEYSSCVLSSDIKSFCWGQGTFGQLGNGSNLNSPVPVLVNY